MEKSEKALPVAAGLDISWYGMLGHHMYLSMSSDSRSPLAPLILIF